MEPEKTTFVPPAPAGEYLDAAFLCVLFAVPFFYLLFPSFLPFAADVLWISLIVPPLAVLPAAVFADRLHYSGAAEPAQQVLSPRFGGQNR